MCRNIRCDSHHVLWAHHKQLLVLVVVLMNGDDAGDGEGYDTDSGDDGDGIGGDADE